MKVEVIPLADIVTISKMVKLSVDTKDDEDDSEDESATASAGTYCMDSQGGMWKKMTLASDLLAGFDYADPQLLRERLAARATKRKNKKRRVRVK